jgi:hypothetical protein
MKLRELSLRDAITPPGSINGAEIMLRGERYGLVYDPVTRMVQVSKGEDAVLVPIENVRFMVPSSEERPAQQAVPMSKARR